jgi:hypothetical protein
MSSTQDVPSNGSADGATKGGLPKDLVNAMQAIFGKHPGYRTSMYLSTFDVDLSLTHVHSSRQGSSC